jgi:polyphosphate glucokinase
MEQDIGFGVDIGGSGIKGAPVSLQTGELIADRLKIATPQPSTPDAVADVVAAIVESFKDKTGDRRPVGVTVPAVVKSGVVRTAANIDHSWIGTNGQALLSERVGRPVHLLNDADAAGVAEARYGAARATKGLVFMATLGTGIGSALLYDGTLIPNSELGHVEIGGHDAEKRAASSVKDREGLTYEEWAVRLQVYFSRIEDLLWPDLIVVGGGVSRKAEKFLPLLHLRAPIVAAQLQNAAGIVGAARLAHERQL